MQSVEQERNLLLSVKEMLENELSSCAMQRELLQSDLTGLSGEHEALKAAYHALSFESAAQQREMLMHNKKAGGETADAEDVEELKRKVAQLEERLKETQLAEKRAAELASALMTMEEQMRLLNLENVKLASTVASGQEEVAQYKKLVESLKGKLKNMSGNKESNFFDSFEEVMQEEMLTMKAAFETKLRLAREEADNLSRKHQAEISKLQATRSPYSVFNNGLAAGSVPVAMAASRDSAALSTSLSSRK